MTVYVVLIDIPEEPSVKVFKTLEVARIYANETVGEYTGVGVKMKQYARGLGIDTQESGWLRNSKLMII